MANFTIDTTLEAVDKQLRMIETSDPVHADIYNALFEKLLNNDAFLERLANKMVEQAMISHVLDSVNPAMVLGADQGPEIIKLIAAIRKSVEDVNSNFGNYTATEMHRTIFRGEHLGTALTSAQKTAIQNGTFDDLWLGDYWIINGIIWRIVDIDYWYNCGDAAFERHHLAIMPDIILYSVQMNETNVTTGGYVGSKMYTTNLNQAKTLVNSAFGSAVISHREYLTNAVSNGRPSAGTWYNSSVELPNEVMMYGHPHLSPTSDGSNIPAIYTISKTQLALLQVCPKFINPHRENQWLRDVVSSAGFALVDSYGHTNAIDASASLGVRPIFPIG